MDERRVAWRRRVGLVLALALAGLWLQACGAGNGPQGNEPSSAFGEMVWGSGVWRSASRP